MVLLTAKIRTQNTLSQHYICVFKHHFLRIEFSHLIMMLITEEYFIYIRFFEHIYISIILILRVSMMWTYTRMCSELFKHKKT